MPLHNGVQGTSPLLEFGAKPQGFRGGVGGDTTKIFRAEPHGFAYSFFAKKDAINSAIIAMI